MKNMLLAFIWNNPRNNPRYTKKMVVQKNCI